MRIVAKDLTYVYGEKSKNLAAKALDNVSLTIEEGEFFGIIGQIRQPLANLFSFQP